MDCAFIMEMEDVKKVIDKIKKGYGLVTKARNLHLHIKGGTLHHEYAFNIFKTLIRESYCDGRQHKLKGLTKLELDKDLAFLTLTTQEARDVILKEGLSYHHKKLRVSITQHCNIDNLFKLQISTTFVTNNIPQRNSMM